MFKVSNQVQLFRFQQSHSLHLEMLRFSKKSSLVRHFQNVHDIVKTDTTDVGEETGSQTFIDLSVISASDLTASEAQNTDLSLSDMNKQFDVEVSYCEDIGDILNVPNDTLFIMDTALEGDNNPVAGHELSKEADTENLEEIEKFLEESKVDPVLETSKASTVTGPKEVRISKDHSYRIPKSPKKPPRLKAYEQQTPHIPYQKEASLTVISVGQNPTKPKVTNPFASSSKTPPTCPKKLSFEEALNVALAPTSKRERIKPTHKTIKVIRAEPLTASFSPSKQKTSVSHTSTSTSAISSPSKLPKTLLSSANNEEKVLDTSKKGHEDKRTQLVNVGVSSTPSMMPGSSRSGQQQFGVVEPRQAEPYKRKIDGRGPEKSVRDRSSHHDEKSRHKDRHHKQSSDKKGSHLGSSSERIHSEAGSSHRHPTELRSSQDKLELSSGTTSILRSFESSSFVDDLGSPPPPSKILEQESSQSSSSTAASSMADQRQHQSGIISSPPLSPEANRGLRQLDLSPKLQATLTSALSNIAAAAPVAAGYYTSRAAASGLTTIESEEEDEKEKGLTLLPTNFPTFDSTSSLISSLANLQSLPSKPTAVVSPSR